MFCPKCGQQQVSEQIKFCSRCGFPLGLVSEVLAHGGFLPQLAQLHGKKNLLTRRNVFRFGLIWFLVFTLILVPVTAILFGDSGVEEVLIPLAAVIGFMGGLLMMLFSLFFQSAPQNETAQKHVKQDFAGFNSNQINGAAQYNQNALPPQSANFNAAGAAYVPPPAAQQQTSAPPPRSNWREANTNELVMPPSVTEDTTKMLDNQQSR